MDHAGSKAAPSSPEVLLSVCEELCQAENPLQGGVDKPPWAGHHVWITTHCHARSKLGAGLCGVFPGLFTQNCFCPSIEEGKTEKQRRFLSQLSFLSAARARLHCVLPKDPAQCISHAVGWHFPSWDKGLGEVTERERCARDKMRIRKNLLQLREPLTKANQG